MKCYYHPDIEAVATCTSCGKAICQSDMVDMAGRIVCKECLATGKAGNSVATTRTTPTNPLAMVSLALGILGLVGCCCAPIVAVIFGAPAGIIGYVARNQIKASQGNQQGEQLAIIGMVVGIAETALALIWILIFVGFFGAGSFSGFLQQLLQSN